MSIPVYSSEESSNPMQTRVYDDLLEVRRRVATLEHSVPGIDVPSSLRFKADVRDVEFDPTDVENLRLRTWRNRVKSEANPNLDVWEAGVVAEELEQLPTLKRFVTYKTDSDGNLLPNGVVYNLLWMPVLAWARARVAEHAEQLETQAQLLADQDEKIAEQADEIVALNSRLADIEARLTALEPEPEPAPEPSPEDFNDLIPGEII